MNVSVTSRIKIKTGAIKQINKAAQAALYKTADQLLSDVKDAQVMPFNTGNLQEDSTFIDDSEIKKMRVSIVSTTPYARRMYFHPEYNFRTTNNANAGGKWFEDWVNGSKREDVSNNFAAFMERELR